VHAATRLDADDFQLISTLGRSLSKAEYLDATATGQLRNPSREPGTIEDKLWRNALWQVAWSPATRIR
jgi:hypothetical protein